MLVASENEWKAHIEELERDTVNVTKEILKEKIIDAIKCRIPNERFGVFLSGGVDSSFIAMMCKKLGGDFVCYSIGLKGAPDLAASMTVAKIFGLEHRCRECSLEEVEVLLKKSAQLFPEPDVLSVSIAAVVCGVIEIAKEDKITAFFSGLGSEEIFAGYHRHGEAKDKHEECWRGLKAMWTRDLVRENIVSKALKFEGLAPFLDDKVIKSAMGIDISKKINETHKKIILREIAEELGLLKEIAWRDKKAAQYGSWFDKALEKLTKMRGFKTKGEFVKSLKRE